MSVSEVEKQSSHTERCNRASCWAMRQKLRVRPRKPAGQEPPVICMTVIGCQPEYLEMLPM